jgi:ubiquinone/menaquinone biosynthesis C-methylase UbiE
MNDLYKDKEEMEFNHVDARNMEFIPSDCFDLIIDKGLFDSQLCGSENITHAHALIQEMYRVLKPGGIYIIISHGAPDSRMGYLTRGVRWAVDHVAVAKPLVQGLTEDGYAKNHYIYTCKKLNTY